jgi:hypothetical protein
MDTGERPDLSSSRESKLILKAETEKLIGFAFEVLNEIGHGLNEEYMRTHRFYPCESVSIRG